MNNSYDLEIFRVVFHPQGITQKSISYRDSVIFSKRASKSHCYGAFLFAPGIHPKSDYLEATGSCI